MMAQLDGLLDFDPDFVLDQYEETRAYYLKSRQRPRRWSFGRCCCLHLIFALIFLGLHAPEF